MADVADILGGQRDFLGGGSSFTGPAGTDPAAHFALFLHDLEPTEGDLLLAGQYLRNQVRDRTFRGESLDGGSFTPYSEEYAKRKGQTNVDLFSRGPSNHMLNALQVRAPMELREIELGIFGDEELATRARIHNEGGEVRTRLGRGGRVDLGASRRSGVEIRKQKKGGKPYSTMPKREWLGARQEDVDEMGRIIVDSITARVQS